MSTATSPNLIESPEPSKTGATRTCCVCGRPIGDGEASLMLGSDGEETCMNHGGKRLLSDYENLVMEHGSER